MNDQLDATQDRVRTLSIVSRGIRSRKETIADTGISLSTFSDFETGGRWPRAATLRKIEAALGWRHGVIDEVIASGIAPDLIDVEMMRGNERVTATPKGLRAYTDREMLQELMRRSAERVQTQSTVTDMFAAIERGDLDLAASKDLGRGIGKGDLPIE